MALVAHGLGGRERLEVGRLGQLRSQLGDIQRSLLSLDTGAQVEIQAALEALLLEVLVRGHCAKAGKLLGQEIELTFRWVCLSPFLGFFFSHQELSWRIVRLGMTWEARLGGWDALRASVYGIILLIPNQEELILLFLLVLVLIELNPTLLNGVCQLANALCFPARGNESIG